MNFGFFSESAARKTRDVVLAAQSAGLGRIIRNDGRPTPMLNLVRRFELVEDYDSSSTTASKAQAYAVVWSESGSCWVADTNTTFYVTDASLSIKGKGKTSSAIGTRGICWLPPDTDIWEIIPRGIRFFYGSTSVPLTGSDTSVSISDIIALDGGTIPDSISADNVINLVNTSACSVLIAEDHSGEDTTYDIVGGPSTAATSPGGDDEDLMIVTRFELVNAKKFSDATATAYPLTYSGGAETCVEATASVFTLSDPEHQFEGTGHTSAAAGSRGTAVFVKEDGRWLIVEMDPAELVGFELSSSLTPTGVPQAVSAFRLNRGGTGGAGAYTPDTATPYTIWDSTGHMRGIGRSESQQGTRFWCKKNLGRWEIVSAWDGPAMMVKGTNYLAVASSATEIELTGVTIMQPVNATYIPGITTNGRLTIPNSYSFSIASNKTVIAVWDESACGYKPLAVPQANSEITVQTDERYDTSTHKFQKKTRKLYVAGADAESAWADVATANQVTIATDVQYSTSTHVLGKITNTAYVLELGTASSLTTIDTAGTC